MVINTDKINYDLNHEIPKLFINDKEVGVVSMTYHYVTSGIDADIGVNILTFQYFDSDSSNQKILSINKITNEIFKQ